MQPLPAGVKLKDRYRVERTLGYGGTGWVYRCCDETSGQRVAVKEAALPSCSRFRLEVCPSGGSGDSKRFDSVKKEMKAEAELMNGQADCPELLRLYDYFEENNTVYVVMELMEGIPLRTYILRGLRLTEEDVRVVGLLLLKAVKVLHNAGLLHLDISPDNIMIADTIKLIDFGAVGKAGEKRKGSLWVRNGYSPPEQHARQAILDCPTDLYAVGAVLYEILTGVRPPVSLLRIDDDTLAAPQELRGDISDDMNQILLKAMAVRPEDRYQSAGEMEGALLRGSDAGEQIKKALLAEAAAVLVLAVTILLMGFFK